MRRLLLALLVCCPACMTPPTQPADLVVINAAIWTADPERPDAEALAVRADRIVAVGAPEVIRPYIGTATTVIDADGRMLTPGFIDSHVHFIDGGFRLASVQLRDAETPEVFADRIAAFARTVPPGTWIVGGDWDHENWGGELPHRDWIDAATRDHPVWVNRLDGHMALANTAALEAAGINAYVADIPGGELVRDDDGRLTGVLKDNAMPFVARAVAEPSAERTDAALDAAMRHVAERGVTSVHHMGTWDDLAVFERAHAERRLITRIYAAVPLATWERLAEHVARSGRGDDWLRIGGLKGFVDGSLGSQTAAFFDPFGDDPSNRGLLVNDEADLRAWTLGADSAGLQLMIHAIGDRAIRLQLDLFEAAQTARSSSESRHRIEHAQHVHPDDLARFADLGVIASMQPYHAIDDGRWAERVIGAERAATTYAFRSLLDQGARVAFGSDWFVAPPSPLEGIYAAVTRRTLDGAHPEGWVPEQKITVEEALRAYTYDAAYASFEDDAKGQLAAGRLADFVILDRDLRRIPPETIPDVRVDLTVVGGRVVFDRLEDLSQLQR